MKLIAITYYQLGVHYDTDDVEVVTGSKVKVRQPCHDRNVTNLIAQRPPWTAEWVEWNTNISSCWIKNSLGFLGLRRANNENNRVITQHGSASRLSDRCTTTEQLLLLLLLLLRYVLSSHTLNSGLVHLACYVRLITEHLLRRVWLAFIVSRVET